MLGPSHGQGIIEKHGGDLASTFVRGSKAKLGKDPDGARDSEEGRIRMSAGEDNDQRSNLQALSAASAADCNGHNRQHFIVEWLRFDKSRTKEEIAKPETEETEDTAIGAPSPPIISANHDPPVLPPRPPPQYVQPQAWGVWCLLAGLFGGRGLQ